MDVIKYAIIGAGMMGQEHIRYLKMLDGVTIVALVDPDETMLAASSKLVGGVVKTYRHYDALLSDDIADVYLIASPNHTHYDILLHLMQKTDKAILVEKPLGINWQQTQAIQKLDRLRKAPTWVAMEYRYMPPLQRLISSVFDGDVGKPVMLTIHEHRYPFLEKVNDWNRFNQNTGGTLVEKCCHYFDLMRLLLKAQPTHIYASGAMNVNHLDERYQGQTPDIIDNAFVVVDFNNATRAMLDLCMFAEGAKWQEIVRVVGNEGCASSYVPPPLRFRKDKTIIESEFSLCRRSDNSEVREVIHLTDDLLVAGDHHGSTYYQHIKFRDMLRSDSPKSNIEVSVEDGHWSVLMGEAAEESIKTGRVIEVG